jgi:hypothetical protein
MIQPRMSRADHTKELRAKLVEHLEAAQAIADETGDTTVAYAIECALDQLRAAQWPASDPNFDVPSKRR